MALAIIAAELAAVAREEFEACCRSVSRAVVKTGHHLLILDRHRVHYPEE